MIQNKFDVNYDPATRRLTLSTTLIDERGEVNDKNTAAVLAATPGYGTVETPIKIGGRPLSLKFFAQTKFPKAEVPGGGSVFNVR